LLLLLPYTADDLLMDVEAAPVGPPPLLMSFSRPMEVTPLPLESVPPPPDEKRLCGSRRQDNKTQTHETVKGNTLERR